MGDSSALGSGLPSMAGTTRRRALAPASSGGCKPVSRVASSSIGASLLRERLCHGRRCQRRRSITPCARSRPAIQSLRGRR
jgi:hypothetical protein